MPRERTGRKLPGMSVGIWGTVPGAGTLEQVDLEEAFAEVPTCMFHHRRTVCSVEVVAVCSSCATHFLTCKTGYDYLVQHYRKNAHKNCGGCHRPVTECWKLVLL